MFKEVITYIKEVIDGFAYLLKHRNATEDESFNIIHVSNIDHLHHFDNSGCKQEVQLDETTYFSYNEDYKDPNLNSKLDLIYDMFVESKEIKVFFKDNKIYMTVLTKQDNVVYVECEDDGFCFCLYDTMQKINYIILRAIYHYDHYKLRELIMKLNTYNMVSVG